jgi:hypothetical protein
MQEDRLESRVDAVFECLLPWQVRKFPIKPAVAWWGRGVRRGRFPLNPNVALRN